MTIWTWILFAALCLALLWISWLLKKGGRRARRRTNRAIRGEQEAEIFLRENGFTVLERQLRRKHSMEIDGEEVYFEVRADLLVRKHSRTYIAEVKTGQMAPKANVAPTRRQLLEYSLIFSEYELLLVDMESYSIREIRFPQTLSMLSEGPIIDG